MAEIKKRGRPSKPKNIQHEIIKDVENSEVLSGTTPTSDYQTAVDIISNIELDKITGERHSKCKTCGVTFEQEVAFDNKTYSNWSECENCRKKSVINKTESEFRKTNCFKATTEYEPYLWQVKAHKDFANHRFQVLACGNRTGKDRYSNMAGIFYFVELLNENRHILSPNLSPSVHWWIIAPDYLIARQNWREICLFFPKQWVVSVSNTTYTMNTIGGGVIEVRSAYNPNSLVSVGLDLVTITEAARIKDLETVWANLEARLNSEGRGLAKDRGSFKYGCGKAIVNSSPIGKNHFYQLWTRGQKDHSNYSSDWISYQLAWTENPSNLEQADRLVSTNFGKVRYEDYLRNTLTDSLFRQNYLADFLVNEGTVFSDFDDKCMINMFSGENILLNDKKRNEIISKWREVDMSHDYVASWDIATGSSKDLPVLGIYDKTDKRLVRVINLYGCNYDAQYKKIAFWCQTYNNAPCIYSLTGHTAVEGQLAKLGVFEITLNEQGGNKARYVQRLERAVQNGAFKILYDGSPEIQALRHQMNDYTELSSGKYGNNETPNDDYVSMLYLLFHDYEADVIAKFWAGMMSNIN